MFVKLKIFAILSIFIACSSFSFAENTSNESKLSSEDFINVSATKGEESAKIKWSLSCEALEMLKENDSKLIISYITKIGKKRAEKEVEGGEWSYTEPISTDKNSFEITGLNGNTDYLF